MKLPYGKLAENDEENVSIFTNHFRKVLNNHKPMDNYVIQEIHLREVMHKLDYIPTWEEYALVVK